jgi:hypothetical protein
MENCLAVVGVNSPTTPIHLHVCPLNKDPNTIPFLLSNIPFLPSSHQLAYQIERSVVKLAGHAFGGDF